MKQTILAITVLLSTSTWCGFTQTSFLRTRVKKQDIDVPVFSNKICTDHNWRPFIQDLPLAAVWRREEGGTEIATVLSRYSMALKNVATNISFWDNFYADRNLVGVRDFKIDAGDFFFVIPREEETEIQWRPAEGLSNIKQRYIVRGTVAGISILSDWINGHKSRWLVWVTTDGELSAIDIVNDPKGLSRLRFKVRARDGLESIYSDGKADGSGKYTLFAWNSAPLTSAEVYRINFDPMSKAFEKIQFTPTIVGQPAGIPSGRVVSEARIVELIQFWVGVNSGDWRIIARLSNDNFVSMNADGQVIEFPIVTSLDGGFRNVSPARVGDVRRIATCNNRKTWRVCTDLMLFEDFSKQGNGIRRMSWIPDGYIYNLPVEVWMKDVSHEENISKPVLYLKNTSTWKSAHGLTLRLWHSKAEQASQTIASDLYYSYLPGVVVSQGASATNGNITYTDIKLPDDFHLGPGESTDIDGLQLGVHFEGYYPGVWDKANDWSWVSVSGTYSLNDKVTVYALGETGVRGKINGDDPPSNYVSQPVIYNQSNRGMYDDLRFWSYPMRLQLSQVRTEGEWGLEIPVDGYNVLETQPIVMERTATSIAFDLLLGLKQPNPYWLGSIDVFIDIRSKGIFNQYVGGIQCQQGMVGQFAPIRFMLSEAISRNIGPSDRLVLRFAINGNHGSDPMVIDGIHLE